jgi:hypothetical protein
MSFGSPGNAANITVARSQPEVCPGQAAPATVPTYWMKRAGPLTANPVPELIDTGQADGTGVNPPPVKGPWLLPYGAEELVSPQSMNGYVDMMTHGGTAGPVQTEIGPYGQVVEQVWTFANTAKDPSMTVPVSIPDTTPPIRVTFNGVYLNAVTVDAAAGAMVKVTTAGTALSFSSHDRAVPEGIPVGTHPGPLVIGQPRSDRLADIYFRVVTVGVVTPFAPATFKVIYKDAGDPAPLVGDWALTPVEFYEAKYSKDDNKAQRGDYDELYDENGADLGTTNKFGTRHPVLAAWPGTITEHVATLAIDDVYVVRGPETAPVDVPVYADESAFTLAAVRTYITLDGEDEKEVARDSAQLLWTHPHEIKFGDSTNFGTSAPRTDDVVLMLNAPYLLENAEFQTLQATGEALAARFVVEGRQIGAPSALPDTPINREMMEVIMPLATVTDAALTLGQTGTIPEARALTSGAGFSIRMRFLEG